MHAHIPTTSLIHQYHRFVDGGAFYIHRGECNAGEFGYVLAGLTGESGELIGEHKKIVREVGVRNDEGYRNFLMANDNAKLLAFLKEMGDVLWYLTRMCSVLDISLGDLMVLNTLKLYDRHVVNGATNAHHLDMPWPYDFITYAEAKSMEKRVMQHINEHFHEAAK